MERLAMILASWGYVGFIRPASGTWGSLAAIPFAILLHNLGGFTLLAIMTVLVFIIGVWATKIATMNGPADPHFVVIDEVAGQWLTLWPMSFGMAQAGLIFKFEYWPLVLVAFILFRVLDVLKPWPANWADRQHTPLGVMADDIFAGIYAAILWLLIQRFLFV